MELKRAKVIALNHNREKLSDYEKSILQYDGANIYHTNLNPCFLYFTTDEKIKEGDWCHDRIQNDEGNLIDVIYKKKIGLKYAVNSTERKIVATTDKSLKKSIFSHHSQDLMKVAVYKDIYLHQPSQAFIQKYVELGGIDEVDIELNEPCCKCDTAEKVFKCIHNVGDIDGSCSAPNPNNDFYGLRLKVDSHNTITIHPIKNSWNREEVEALCESAWLHGYRITEETFYEWKTKNLN